MSNDSPARADRSKQGQPTATRSLTHDQLVSLRGAAIRCVQLGIPFARLSGFRSRREMQLAASAVTTERFYQCYVSDLRQAVGDAKELLPPVDAAIIPDQTFTAKYGGAASAHNAAVAVGHGTWQAVEGTLKEVYRRRHPDGDFDAACQQSFPQGCWVEEETKTALYGLLVQLSDPPPAERYDLEGAVVREHNAMVRLLLPAGGADTPHSERGSNPSAPEAARTVDGDTAGSGTENAANSAVSPRMNAMSDEAILRACLEELLERMDDGADALAAVYSPCVEQLNRVAESLGLQPPVILRYLKPGPNVGRFWAVPDPSTSEIADESDYDAIAVDITDPFSKGTFRRIVIASGRRRLCEANPDADADLKEMLRRWVKCPGSAFASCTGEGSALASESERRRRHQDGLQKPAYELPPDLAAEVKKLPPAFPGCWGLDNDRTFRFYWTGYDGALCSATADLFARGILTGEPTQAPWLPTGWARRWGFFPAGPSLPWVVIYLDFAISLHTPCPGAPTAEPSARDMLANAYMLVRPLGRSGYPPEPLVQPDLLGCLGALRELRAWAAAELDRPRLPARDGETAKAAGGTAGAGKSDDPPAPNAPSKQPAGPFVPLTSWAEIFTALNEPHGKPVWKNDESTQNKIKKMNAEHGGPIVIKKGRGHQPRVSKGALMNWWNSLEEHYVNRAEEATQDAESAKLTASDTFAYGAAGTVAPGIGGHVKKSRKPK